MKIDNKTLKRKLCLIDNKSILKNIYTIKNFPIFNGAADKKKNLDQFNDMKFGVSKYGLVQLTTLIDPKKLYKTYHSESIGKIWLNHNLEFSKFVNKFIGHRILEIGSGNFKLAKLLIKKQTIKSWLCVEPSNNKIKIKSNKFKLVSNFIEKIDQKHFRDSDTLVHSHTLEHLYDPISTLKKILENSKINKIIFSVPNISSYVKKNYSNALNFEHTYYLSEELTNFILKELNFIIKKKTYFKNHSIFYYAKRTEKNFKNIKPNLSKHKFRFLKMIKFYEKKVKEINQQLDKKNSNNFIFGAHVFTQFLIKLGLNEEKIINVLDNSNYKKNKRLYGTNLIIKKPNILKKIKNANVIVRTGEYQKEIENQLKKYNDRIKIIK